MVPTSLGVTERERESGCGGEARAKSKCCTIARDGAFRERGSEASEGVREKMLTSFSTFSVALGFSVYYL